MRHPILALIVLHECIGPAALLFTQSAKIQDSLSQMQIPLELLENVNNAFMVQQEQFWALIVLAASRPECQGYHEEHDEIVGRYHADARIDLVQLQALLAAIHSLCAQYCWHGKQHQALSPTLSHAAGWSRDASERMHAGQSHLHQHALEMAFSASLVWCFCPCLADCLLHRQQYLWQMSFCA